MDVHRERLAANFIELCEIESPSRQEGRMSARLRQLFQEIGGCDIILELLESGELKRIVAEAGQA